MKVTALLDFWSDKTFVKKGTVLDDGLKEICGPYAKQLIAAGCLLVEKEPEPEAIEAAELVAPKPKHKKK